MSLAQYARILVKHWFLAVIPGIVLVTLAMVASFNATPLYTARASAWFTLPVGQSGSDLFQGASYTQAQLGSYAELATKPIVLEPVIESLGLETTSNALASTISASVLQESVIIEISATDPDPEQAAEVANAVIKEVAQVAKNLAPSLENGDSAVSAAVVSPARQPSGPSSPNTKRNVLAAALAGLFLGMVLPVAREVLDNKVRGSEDLPSDVPLLATLPKVPFLPGARSAKRRSHHGDFVMTESLRKVQAGLRFLDVERPVKVIAISSSISAEGKTSLSLRLARVMAEGAADVLLIDADLRKPQIADRLALEGGIGLADVLAGEVTLEQAVQRALSPRLHVLPAGSAVPNPGGLLASSSMSALIEELRGRYAYVVIDAPPLLPVADASVLATHVDGLLLVARHGKVTRAQVASSVQQLNQVDARVLGAIINATPRGNRFHTRKSTYYYGREVGEDEFDARSGIGANRSTPIRPSSLRPD